MTLPVRFLPEARQEAIECRAWYEQRQSLFSPCAEGRTHAAGKDAFDQQWFTINRH